jgi:hypothetical protein
MATHYSLLPPWLPPACLPACLPAALNLDLRYDAENGALMAGPANPLIFAAHPRKSKLFFPLSPIFSPLPLTIVWQSRF